MKKAEKTYAHGNKKAGILVCATFILLICTFVILFFIMQTREVKIILDKEGGEIFTQQQLTERGHIRELPEYNTNVSVGYENSDGTKTLYIFSSPYKYKNSLGQLKNIDTRIISITDEKMRNNGYIYAVKDSDIISLFPRELSKETGICLYQTSKYKFFFDNGSPSCAQYITKQNFIGEEKNMILYDNICGENTSGFFYPSSTGINCEITFGEKYSNSALKVVIELEDGNLKMRKDKGGYIVLYDTRKIDGSGVNDIYGVIKTPLLKKNENGEVKYNNSYILNKIKKNTYEIEMQFNDTSMIKNMTAFLSFEIRRENQPDNAIYSGKPDLKNNFLTNYSIIGNSKDYGVGRNMIRFVLTESFKISQEDIIKAEYHTYSLYSTTSPAKLEMRSIMEDWCSVTGNWNRFYKYGDQVSFLNANGHDLTFDITKEVMQWCNTKSPKSEYFGLLMKNTEEKEGEYQVILSNDNTLFKNYTMIKLK